MDTPATSFGFRRVVPVAAFLAVLVVATFFVGDTGVYNDDYFLNQRDPVTGEIGALVMNRPWHLWRPMTRRVLPPIVTTLWDHPWAMHAISAGLHAAVVGLLYGLLRKFRVPAAIAGPCALLFMVYPVHFEAVLWSSIICTLMSVVLVMGIWHTYVGWLANREPVGGVRRAAVLGALGGAAWCAAAFNEQPPGALAALPLAVMVVGLAGGSTRIERLRRSAMPVVAVGVGLGVYLWGFFRHQSLRPPPGVKRAAHPPLAERLDDLVHKIPGDMAMRDFARGAFAEGVRAIEGHPGMAAAGVAVLGIAAAAWVCGRRESVAGSDRPRTSACVWLVVLGLAWMVASWIPVVAAHSVTSSRLYYVPSIGCAMALAGAAGLVVAGVGTGGSRRVRGIGMLVRAAVAGVVGVALVVWIGVEANLQRRCALDRAEIRPIVEAVGSTIEPETFLVPVRIESRSVLTGSGRFDGYFQPCWYWEFAAGWRAQAALRSRGVYTFQTGPGVAESLWLSPVDPLHAGLIRAKSARPKPENLVELLPACGAQGRSIAWDRVVLFETPEAGVTRVFTRVRLHVPGSAPVEIVPRQIAIARPARPLPEVVLDVYPMPADRAHPRGGATRTGRGTGSARSPR